MFGLMANAAKRKGERAEREAAEMLTELLGLPMRRKLGAGRLDDIGDLDGLQDCVIQVADWPSDTLRAVREKPVAAEVQRLQANAPFAMTAIRMRGGLWRIVQTPEQWAQLYRATV